MSTTLSLRTKSSPVSHEILSPRNFVAATEFSRKYGRLLA